MKKIINTGLVVAMIVLLSSTAKAQYFYTSYGYTQNWFLPEYIDYAIHDHYYGYEVAHARRIAYHGYYNYNVLLVRNGIYMEVRFDRFGHPYKTIRYRSYPLASHVCGPYCGYHPVYYRTYYYPTYYGHHHGHHQKTVYINSGHHHSQPHVNNQYYTNVYVQKPNQQHQRQQHYYQNNHDNGTQHQRTNGEIRKPVQQQRHNDSRQVQRQSTSGRSQYFSPQSVTRGSGREDNGRKLVAYKNARGQRDDR